MTFSSFLALNHDHRLKKLVTKEGLWHGATTFRSISFVFILLLFSGSHTSAQQFGASIVAGLNAAQITGDDLAGYNKPGILLGLKSSVYLTDKMDFNVELLYSERGSKSNFFGGGQFNQAIKLQYLEIPLVFTYLDWLSNDADYYRMHFHVGFSFGTLFSSSITDDANALQVYDGQLNKTDLGYLFGFTYKANQKLGVGIRYNNSINKLYSQTNAINAKELQGYFLSLRFEYSLL